MRAKESIYSSAESLRTLIGIIVGQHHAYLKREFPSIEKLLAEIVQRGSGQFCQTASAVFPVFLRFRRELEAHMKREEVTLFPLIDRMEAAIAEGRPVPRNPFGPLSNAIQFMNEDHDFENQLLGIMTEISGGFALPAEAPTNYALAMSSLRAMTIDLTEHVRKEDEVLFPQTIRVEDSARLHELRM